MTCSKKKDEKQTMKRIIDEAKVIARLTSELKIVKQEFYEYRKRTRRMFDNEVL